MTRTDSKSVSRSTQYELTAENFSKFLAAADSIVTLEARDSAARAYLSHDLTDAGASDADAGLRYLEANDAVSRVINGAGRRAFHDESERGAADADATDLTRLHNLREGRPAVTVTP